MKIKQHKHTSGNKALLKTSRVNMISRKIVLVLLFIVFQIILIGGSMYYAVQLYVSGQVNTYHEVIYQVVSVLKNPYTVTKNYLNGVMSSPRKLTIDFKFEDWQGLVEKHNEAVKTNSLFKTDNPTFPAKIRINGDNINVRVRLKGGGDHFKRGKWSFRVEVRDDDKSIFGMRRFSLQHPATRMYLNEWVMHQIMKREGVMALPYDFVSVMINGRYEGIYAFEGHFTKELMEWNTRQPGVLLSFDQALDNLNSWQNPWASEAREIDSYQTPAVTKDENLREQFIAARSLLEQFRRHEINTCDIFDCRILATYFALLDIMGGQHSLEPGNFKMYYNPNSLRIEPVFFDAETDFGDHELFLQTWANYETAPESAAFIRTIFSDQRFMELYINELIRLTQPTYISQFFLEIEDAMNEKLDIIYKSYPAYLFDRGGITQTQNRIREVLNAKKGIQGYVDTAVGQNITVEVGTVLPFPVEIRGIQCAFEQIELAKPIQIDPYAQKELIKHKIVQFSLPPAIKAKECVNDELYITYSIIGQDIIRKERPSLLPRQR